MEPARKLATNRLYQTAKLCIFNIQQLSKSSIKTALLLN